MCGKADSAGGLDFLAIVVESPGNNRLCSVFIGCCGGWWELVYGIIEFLIVSPVRAAANLSVNCPLIHKNSSLCDFRHGWWGTFSSEVFGYALTRIFLSYLLSASVMTASLKFLNAAQRFESPDVVAGRRGDARRGNILKCGRIFASSLSSRDWR